MGYHRQIDQRLFGDRKYLQLSKEPPSGRGLWKYLLTGPHHVGLPGLFFVGRLALAEALEWPIGSDHSLDHEPTFTSCWNEIARLEMAEADWPARVIFLPGTFRQDCNKPRNPNVLINWRSMFDLVPESPLREKWIRSLGAHCRARGAGFSAAFDDLWNHCRNDSPNDSRNDSAECHGIIAQIGNGNGNGITHTGAPASKKQIAYIRSLLVQSGKEEKAFLASAGRDHFLASDLDDLKAAVAAHVPASGTNGVSALDVADLEFEFHEGGERGARAWIQTRKPEMQDKLLSHLKKLIGGQNEAQA